MIEHGLQESKRKKYSNNKVILMFGWVNVICYFDRYQLFTLHSNMQPQDQQKAMQNSPEGVRKLVNIYIFGNPMV